MASARPRDERNHAGHRRSVGRLWPNAGVRPLNGPEPHHILEPLRARPVHEHARPEPTGRGIALRFRRGGIEGRGSDTGRNCDIISSAEGPPGSVQQSGIANARVVPRTQVEGAAVTVIDGDQKVARVRKSGRRLGVEVTERDHDDDRERDEGVINPAARSQHDRGSNLHPRCRTGGVSSPRVSTYTPSHTSPYTPVPAKSLHINQIPTQHTTPRCRK